MNYVVYGNTEYLDILTIQTDFIGTKGYRILFLDANDLDLTHIYSKYNNVVFYDKNDTYARRLLSCLNQIDLDYFLLLHDIDILLDVNESLMNNFLKFLKTNEFDRIDLKHSNRTDGSLLFKFDTKSECVDWVESPSVEVSEGLYLVKQDDVNNYIYNVNPSIWKRESLIDIMSNFNNKTYRDIESIDVQLFSKKFKIFKIFSKDKLCCGYYNCLPFFKFLHISHGGKLLTLNEGFTTEYGQSYKDVGTIYTEIVNKYSLTKSNKWVG